MAVSSVLGSRMVSRVPLAVRLDRGPEVEELALFGNGLVVEVLSLSLAICSCRLRDYVLERLPPHLFYRPLQPRADENASRPFKPTLAAVERVALRLPPNKSDIILQVTCAQVHFRTNDRVVEHTQVPPKLLPLPAAIHASPPALAVPVAHHVDDGQRLDVQDLVRMNLGRALLHDRKSQALAPRRQK